MTQSPRMMEVSVRVEPVGINSQHGDAIFMLGEANQQRLCFTITNNSTEKVRFDRYTYKLKADNKLVDVDFQDEKQLGCGGTFIFMEPSEDYLVTMYLNSKGYEGCASVPIRVTFNFDIAATPLLVVKSITYDVVELEEDKILYKRLTSPPRHDFEDFSTYVDDDDDHLDIIWLDTTYKPESELELTLPLHIYAVPSYIRQFGKWPLEEIGIRLELNGPSYSNYEKFFHRLLSFEELQCVEDIKRYTIRKTKLQNATDSATHQRRYKLEVRGLSEKRPSLMRGDRIFATPLIEDNLYKYEGGVDYISLNNAFVIFNKVFGDEDFDEDDIADTNFKIEFRFNRISLRLMHRAVQLAVENDLEGTLFPTGRAGITGSSSVGDLKFYTQEIQKNPQQMTAVKHIVGGTSRPAPYIIYGPPGTGKTFTLVEAIKQVHKVNPHAHILVCAPTNDAADLITKGLMEHILLSNIIRLNAASRSLDSYAAEMRPVANRSTSSKQHVYPSKVNLRGRRIVVCTLITSGRLVSAEMTDHFTHVFIDEAGYATEPESLIPLSLLNFQKGGQLVLAGDPKQLGPIMRSMVAQRFGLGTSLLKRLMDIQGGPYQPDSSKRYNARFVTKLVRSFRSHPAIIKVPNERFYGGELEICTDVTVREKFCNWKHLPPKGKRKKFPMMFHGVQGTETREYDSPSWLNKLEIILVVKYIEKLLAKNSVPSVEPSQIGIISPYHKQVTKIQRILKETSGWENIKVGSVEKFQGSEREVIIISTVRSDNKVCADDSTKSGLGFLANEKRFNVAVTRAKALLIIIGNPVTLSQEQNWRSLIMQIIESGGYIGSPDQTQLLKEIEGMPTNQSTEETPRSTERHKGPSDYQQMVNDEWEYGAD